MQGQICTRPYQNAFQFMLMDRAQLKKIEPTMFYALQLIPVCFLLIHRQFYQCSLNLHDLHERNMNPDSLKPKWVGLLQ